MAKISNLTLLRKPELDEHLTADTLVQRIEQHAQDLVRSARQAAASGDAGQPRAFREVETELRTQLFALGRLLLTLFLTLAEEAVRASLPARLQAAGRSFRRAPPQARSLNTLFGVVRYRRTYMREFNVPRSRKASGFHPLDQAIGLSAERVSFNLLTLATRLAVKLPFAEARETLGLFVEGPPSTEVIEKATLGLGRYTADFFEQAPPIRRDEDGDDGEVLLVMIDSKGIPTATDSELERRRGPRKPRATQTPSRRHRGRELRQRYPARPRRKKGDKSKNAKMATQVVMFTLRREGERLVGPLNTFRYASLAPKRHAFDIALREAKKRGFVPDDAGRFDERDGRLVQLVFDGDLNLEAYAREFFPGALLTVDVMHVLNYVWSAGLALHEEGSAELSAWFTLQKERLYGDHLADVLDELRSHLRAVARTGPGTKLRRERLGKAIEYLEKRASMMGYGRLIERDLEIGSGAVEGAVKHVIAKRFDHGGMRWIRERAETLLQLRCIELNGQWEAFCDFVHSRMLAEMVRDGRTVRLQSGTPPALPRLLSKAA